MAEKILQIHAQIDDLEPAIWRRFEAPESLSLLATHRMLQVAFGWHDAHLWEFSRGDDRYSLGGDPGWGRATYHDAGETTLGDALGSRGKRLDYWYDFGDDWRVTLRVERRGEAEEGVAYPRLVGGERAGPPEDCGGPWAYADLLAGLEAGDLDEDYVRWLGDFDPARFDLADVPWPDRELLELRPRRATPPDPGALPRAGDPVQALTDRLFGDEPLPGLDRFDALYERMFETVVVGDLEGYVTLAIEEMFDLELEAELKAKLVASMEANFEDFHDHMQREMTSRLAERLRTDEELSTMLLGHGFQQISEDQFDDNLGKLPRAFDIPSLLSKLPQEHLDVVLRTLRKITGPRPEPEGRDSQEETIAALLGDEGFLVKLVQRYVGDDEQFFLENMLEYESRVGLKAIDLVMMAPYDGAPIPGVDPWRFEGTSALATLRRCGLVVVGLRTVGERQVPQAVIPNELRKPLRALFDLKKR